MTFRYLRKFYEKYFNYPASSRSLKQRRAFAFAIQNTHEVLASCYNSQSLTPLDIYTTNPNSNQLAVKFLENIRDLSTTNRVAPFSTLHYYETILSIDKSLINSNRKGIFICFNYIWDSQNNQIIFLGFGNSPNINYEFEVLQSLANEFVIKHPFSKSCKFFTHWDVTNGTETQIDISQLNQVSRMTLLNKINKF